MRSTHLLIALLLSSAAIAPTFVSADVVWAPGISRVMRVIVDMDAEYTSRLTGAGLDAYAKAQEWVNETADRMRADVNVSMEIVQWHQRTSSNNLANPAEQSPLTHPTNFTKPAQYIEIVAKAWESTPDHDLIILLSGKSFGSAGVANDSTAGQDKWHVAIVKEQVTNTNECEGLGACAGPYEAWMPNALMHEVGHTIGADHQYANCGPQDTTTYGCTVMLGLYSEPEDRVLEYSEANEEAIRTYVDQHLPAEDP